MLSSKRLTMFSVSLAIFMDVLDSNVINTAIPQMAKSFNIPAVDLKTTLISYLLSLAVCTPMSGWVADRFGSKKVFIWANILFTISSFCCGFSHTLTTLVIFRTIQGIGGAFMLSLGRLIIAQTFERHLLVRVMNAVVILMSAALMLGPVVGGFITEHFSWPWIFWVNLPFGFITALVAYYGITNFGPQNQTPFDLIGSMLFGGSLALLCYALSALGESSYNLQHNMLLMGISVFLFIVFTLYAKRFPYPIIQMDLFQYRTLRISTLGNLLCRLGFGGIPFLLPILQQGILGFSPELSGLLLVPIAFGVVFSKLLAFRALCLLGYRGFLCINTILLGLSIMALNLINMHSSVYFIALLTFIFGVFTAAQYTAMNSLAFAEVSAERFAALTSITSTTQIFAQTLGVAIGAILLQYFSPVHADTTRISISSFQQSFNVMGIITIISILIFIPLKRQDGQQMLVKE